MSDSIINVENLSKKYVIDHQRKRGGQTFREMLTGKMSSIFHPHALRSPENDAPARHEDFWALNGINFDVKQGEVLGIVGRNGAGKSTLLKILSRITEPTSGRIRIGGRVASLLEVGTGFHPELTGRENIFLNGAVLGMSKLEIQRKFDEIVDFAGIEQFLDTPVKRYSSGMYVRLAFAVAAHLEPEILIIDEVLAVGDAEFQKKCLGKMHNVATSEGRTVLFVSHSMPAVRKLCSRGIMLERGKLKLVGSVDEIVSCYAKAGAENTYNFESDRETPYIAAAHILSQPPNTDSDLDIWVEWVLTRDVPGAKIGLGLNTTEGERVFDCTPEDYGEKSPDKKGRHKAIFRVPAGMLMAREYLVSIGVWQNGCASFDHVDPALQVRVEKGITGPYSHESGREGLVNIPCRWMIQE